MLEDDEKTESIDLILNLAKLNKKDQMLKAIENAIHPYNGWQAKYPTSEDDVTEAMAIGFDLMKIYHRAKKLSNKVHTQQTPVN